LPAVPATKSSEHLPKHGTAFSCRFDPLLEPSCVETGATRHFTSCRSRRGIIAPGFAAASTGTRWCAHGISFRNMVQPGRSDI
jgi:hypothetical protein